MKFLMAKDQEMLKGQLVISLLDLQITLAQHYIQDRVFITIIKMQNI